MPNFVRPAFLALRSPGRTSKSFSAVRDSGYIEADLTLRTPVGAVSRPIQIRAGVYNLKGEIDALITIPKGFVVEVKPVVPGGARSILITPTNEA
jgi:hypothetical protein